jgi:tetratricopeptide (TPR) repeat protein
MARWDRAITDCTICLKDQPDDWELWYLRAVAYRGLAERGLALADLTRALARGDRLVVRRERAELAFTLRKWGLAVADYTELAKQLPKDDSIHQRLGAALYSQGKPAEAVEPLRRAVALQPRNEFYLRWLGFVLNAQGKHEEASAALRQAVELVPTSAEAHGYLGDALRGLGRLDEALKSYRRCLALTPPNAPIRGHWQWLVTETERMLRQAGRISAVLSGKAKCDSAAEALDLARLCRDKKWYAASARLSAEALAAEPKLAADLKGGYRYNAACWAALAGCGQGTDADTLDAQKRARLRKQALVWLRADLALWAKRLARGQPQDREQVVTAMRHWQRDSDLAGLRESAAVAKLPADEREACRQLWADVQALLHKAGAKPK